MPKYTCDFLLNEKVKIYQPQEGYRASTDAVFLASLLSNIKEDECILDVGSGTGAVSLCLAHRFPHNKIIGIEIQPQLVALANKSTKANNFKNLTYLEADIKNKSTGLQSASFNHVVTNPPYYRDCPPSPDQSKALARNMTALTLKDWLHFCLKMLKPYGWLYLIHRAEALTAVLNALDGKAGNIKLTALYSKSGQNAKRIMICAQKSSQTPLQILPIFRMHTQDGSFTSAAKSILRYGEPFFAQEDTFTRTGRL